jgi:hypothetical protein
LRILKISCPEPYFLRYLLRDAPLRHQNILRLQTRFFEKSYGQVHL